MANALYDKGREGFLQGEISWDSGNIDVILVAIGGGVDEYDVDLAADQFLQDIPVNARKALLSDNAVEPTELQNKDTTDGIADADDCLFESVPENGQCGAVIIYQREAVDTETTSRLIAYIDTAVGLPVVPNNGDILIEWDDGANKIFKL